MSFSWIAKVGKLKTGSPAQKLVLLALADFSNEDGRCYPSIKKIGEITEQSESTIKRALCDLVEAGFIKKLQRRRRKDGRLSVYEYQILTTAQCDQRSNQPQGKMTSKPDVKMISQEPVISEPIKTPLRGVKNPHKDFQDEFDEFWSNIWQPYDMAKGSKQIALKKFTQYRKKGVSYEIIERGSKKYIDFCHRTECRTKHAGTWLSQQGWQDEYPDNTQVPPRDKYARSRGYNPTDALALALADQTRR
jgi:hypothetical protein